MNEAPSLPLATCDVDDPAAKENAAWLDSYLERCVDQYTARQRLGPSEWRGQALSPDEVSAFRRAVENEFVTVDESDGLLLIDRFHTPKRYRLFQTYEGGVARPGKAWSWSWREVFSQLAFACELVLDHDWATSQVALEVGSHDLGAGSDPVNSPVLLGEAKVKVHGQSGLDGMLGVFSELAGGPAAQVGVSVRTNATRKYTDRVRLRPSAFVAIAPGVRRVFDVIHDAEHSQALLSPRTSGLTPAEMAPNA